MTAELSGEVYIIDREKFVVSGKIEFLPPGMRKTDVTPVGLVITRDGKTAYVTLGHAAHVAVVDVPTRKIQGYILVGKRSWGITLSRDEATLFVANGFGDDVTVIDAKTRRAKVSIPVGRIPWGVGSDEGGRRPRVAHRRLRRRCDGCRRANRARPTAPRVTVGFVDIEGDPRHEPIRAYERIVLKLREHPFAGAQVGIDEAQILSRVLKIDFAPERIRVKSAEDIAPAVLRALESRDLRFFIVDAPAEAFAAGGRGARPTCSSSTPPRRRTAAPRAVRARSCTRRRASPCGWMRSRNIWCRADGATFWCCRARSRPTRSPSRRSSNRRRNSAPASWRISISRPAPIRASASRTTPRC